MVGIFGDEHLGDGRFRRQPALDQARRRGRLHHHILAGAAGILRTAHDQHPELGRHQIEALGHILADAMQDARAAGADLALHVDDALDPRQVGRQRSPVRPAPGGPSGALGRRLLLGLGVTGRLDLLGLLQPQEKLVLGQALGPAPEAVTLQLLDDLAEPFALGTLGQEHRLEQAEVVRKRLCRRAHEAD